MLSKSKIKTLLQCPHRYKLTYIDRIPIQDNVHLKRGRDFHERMEKIDDNDFEPQEEAEQYVYDVHNDLISKEWQIIYTEEKFEVPDMEIRGIIDKLYYISKPGVYFDVNVKEPAYCITEFKTGKFNDKKLQDTRFDLGFYAILINNSTELHVDYMLAIFPDVKKLYFNKLTMSTFKSVIKKMDYAKEVIQNGMFEKKIDILCNWCPYAELCFSELYEQDDEDLRTLNGLIW